jgi:hypothetical protein
MNERVLPGERVLAFALLVLSLFELAPGRLGAQIPPLTSSPAMLVQIKCKPGTAELWLAEFKKEILPSVQEAIAKGDGITSFSYMETVLPAQPFDFVLLYEVKTLGALDTKRPFPHYAALFRRVGAVRGGQILKEMGAWEEEVRVTIVYAHGGVR